VGCGGEWGFDFYTGWAYTHCIGVRRKFAKYT
jgi:hypothetical protein